MKNTEPKVVLRSTAIMRVVLLLVVFLPGISRAATNTFNFTYTNRAALLADGWSFNATNPDGTPRNTGITDTNIGAVVSYDQTAHPGVLQIPCDVGYLWSTPVPVPNAVQANESLPLSNMTRNSLFRSLPTNWVSMQLTLSFAPAQNYQGAILVLYQDDDNYLDISFVYNSGESVGMDREFYGFPSTVSTTIVAGTNMVLRLDRDVSTGNISGFYSLDGTNWMLTAQQVSQSFTNARFGIVVGGAPSTFPLNNLPNCNLSGAVIITSDTYTSPPPVLMLQPQHLVFNSVAGQPCTNVQELHIALAGDLNPALPWTVTSNATWLSTSGVAGNTAGSCDVSVDNTGLAPGTYQAALQVSAPGATSAVAGVTLIVNPDTRVRVSTWQGGKAAAMSVSVDDSNPTDFDELSTNGFCGSYMIWGLSAPSFATNYYQAGMELGCHTVDHPCFEVNEPTLRYELETNITGLVGSSPEPQSKVISFAWPCGVGTIKEEVVAADYFLAARGSGFNQLEDPSPITFMNLKSYDDHENPPYPPADFKTLVDAAIAQGKWYNQLLHTTNDYDDGVIVYAVGKNIWVAPIGSVTKYILQRDRVVITNYVEASGYIQFNSYRLSLDPSSKRSFETAFGTNDLLTFQVDITGVSTVFGLLVNGIGTPYTNQVINGRTLLLFNALVTTNMQTAVVQLQSNRPPVLAAKTNVVVNEQTLLMVTNTATDPDTPAQTLTYTLVNPPTGAVIDTNGVIRWTPNEAQGPGTNVITTVVTDNGSPPLSATNSFTVIVNEVNTPPVLPVQNSRLIIGTNTLVVINTASDSDIPVNPLGYRLLVAPAGAVINTNGVITWTPGISQVPSTNTFTTVVTDTNVWAVNAHNLSATNSFTVTVSTNPAGPVLPSQTNLTVNELATLVVTNTATDLNALTNVSAVGQLVTNTAFFTYTNRTALLADGWSFIATNPDGSPRNTEVTDTNLGPVVSYDQIAHPGTLRIPACAGGIWGTLPAFTNDTQNMLFRSLSSNWLSMQLTVAFSPTQDDQGVHLLFYQDDDNYVMSGFAYNDQLNSVGKEVGTLIWEINGSPNHAFNPLSSVTNISLRLDRESISGNVSGSYSLDGTNWVLIATVPQSLVNPRLGITSEGSPSNFPLANLPNADFSRLDVIVTNFATSALLYQLVNSPAGATIDTNGVITWTPNEAQGPGTYTITTAVTDNEMPPLSATNSFNVTVNEVNSAPTLPAQGNRAINNTTTLVVTNTATDPDIPANTLAYQLINSPTNAVINTNGIITWTPGISQAPGTNTFTFTTVVTDNGAPPLSATNSFTVTVQINGPELGVQTNQVINELTTLIVTNTAIDTGLASSLATNSYYFTYANRAALLADGWSFIATNPGGTPRDTENTDTNLGPVISYDQTVHPGVLRIPVGGGGLWGSENDSTNTLFQNLPTNWVSMQLEVAFTPAQDYQGITFMLYQDDDNYVEMDLVHNGSEKVSMDQELNGIPVSVNETGVTTTNVFLRLDRDSNTGNISGLYSLDGTNWVLIGQAGQAFANPRLGIMTGGSLDGFPNADLQQVDIVTSNNMAVILTYQLINPPTGALIDTNGIITWTPAQNQSPSTNTITTVVTDNGTPNLSATNSFIVIVTVNEVNVAPVLPVIPLQTVNELNLLTVTNTATDSDQHATILGYGLISPPAGMTINANGIITWTPAQNQSPSTNTITTVVTNSDAFDLVNPRLTATNNFTVIVREVNVAPVLPVLSNQTIIGLGTLLVTNAATEPNNHALTTGYALINPLAGMSINGSGVISWTPVVTQVPSTNIIRTVVANSDPFDLVNPVLTATNNFTVTVQAIHNGPSLLNQANQTNNELTLLVVTNSAVDNDVPPLPLSYSLVVATVTNMLGNSTVTNAIINTNGVITWTPSEGQGPGVYTFKTVVSDGSLSATNSFTVVVNDVNIAPVLPPQFNRTIHGKLLMVVTNTATDLNIPASSLTYSLLVKPNGATIDTNGVISWTPVISQVPSTNTITTVVANTNAWAVNAKSLSATNSFTVVVTVNVVNTPPWLPAQTNRVVNEQTTLVVTNTGMDSNIPANALSYTLLAAPTGAAINSNGIITWTPTQVQSPSTNTITTVVTDNGSPPMSATNNFTVIVKEVNVAPVLPVVPPQTVNELTLLTVTNTATNSDLHATILGYGLVNPPAGMSISANGIITWTPAQNQSPSTNTITTVVTNSDAFDLVNPRLTATNSFTVIVREVNVAPVLPVVSTQTVSALTLLTVINTATEPNIHATTIGYRLVNPPAGMTINVNGIITWTPTQAQSPGTNIITTVVTNSDAFDLVNPQLTATNNFTVIVTGGSPPPVIQSISVSNSVVTVKWSAVSGRNYRLQYMQNLTDSTWSNVVPDITATGSIATATNGVNNSTQQFYRVILLP